MKQLSILTLCISLLLAGCKKDHPNDIPAWVKQSIKEFKRAGKSHGLLACMYCPVKILEYRETTTNTILYAFETCDPDNYDFYTESGQLICGTPLYCPNSGCNCGSYNTTNMVFVRTIWIAHCTN